MIHIGQINLSKEVVISDPCYYSGIWCSCSFSNMKPGLYDCYINMEQECELTEVTDKKALSKYGRVKELIVIHSDCKDKITEINSTIGCRIGVDSGTCGIFDKAYYDEYHNSTKEDKHNDWYDKFVCGEIGNTIINFNITENLGVWSESGYGDGLYQFYIAGDIQSDSEIYGIRLEFIDELEDDEHWYDLDEDYDEEDSDWYDDEDDD